MTEKDECLYTWSALMEKTAEEWPKPLSDEAYLAILFNQQLEILAEQHNLLFGEPDDDPTDEE